MTLYEIDCGIAEAVDCETGEIIDYEKLCSLQMERSKKIEQVALFIKNLESNVTAYKAEIDAFNDRKQRDEAKAKSLKAWLAEALSGQKFSTAKCSVTFRKSVQVKIDDEAKIPTAYMTEKTTYTPDKKAIKEAINSGLEVDGCCLVENQNIKIV